MTGVLLIGAFFAAVCAFLVTMATRCPVGIPAGAAIGFSLPFMFLKFKRTRRLRAFEDQLAWVGGAYHAAQRVEFDALNTLAARVDTRVQTPAGDVHRAAILVRDTARDFIGSYRDWIEPYLENNRHKICETCALDHSSCCPCPMDYLAVLLVQAVETVDRRHAEAEQPAGV